MSHYTLSQVLESPEIFEKSDVIFGAFFISILDHLQGLGSSNVLAFPSVEWINYVYLCPPNVCKVAGHNWWHYRSTQVVIVLNFCNVSYSVQRSFNFITWFLYLHLRNSVKYQNYSLKVLSKSFTLSNTVIWSSFCVFAYQFWCLKME